MLFVSVKLLRSTFVDISVTYFSVGLEMERSTRSLYLGAYKSPFLRPSCIPVDICMAVLSSQILLRYSSISFHNHRTQVAVSLGYHKRPYFVPLSYQATPKVDQKIFVSDEIRTWGSWVRSANTSSQLSPPPSFVVLTVCIRTTMSSLWLSG